MSRKRHTPKEIAATPRQVDVYVIRREAFSIRVHSRGGMGSSTVRRARKSGGWAYFVT